MLKNLLLLIFLLSNAYSTTLTSPPMIPGHPAAGCVIVYEHCGFQGKSLQICGNKSMNHLGWFDRKVTSIKVGRFAKVQLFSGTNKKGERLMISKSQCLGRTRWNDKARSLRVFSTRRPHIHTKPFFRPTTRPYFIREPVSIFEIKSPRAGKCIGLNRHRPNRQLSLQYCGKTKETQWRKQSSKGKIYFKNVATGLVMDVHSGSKGNGAKLIQYRWHGGNNQLFTIGRHRRGHVYIKNARSGKCVDIAAYRRNINAIVHQWSCHNGWNQQWMLVRPGPPRRVSRPHRNPNHPADGCVMIYQHCNYGGWKQHICGNKALNSLGKFHRQISSVKVGRNAKVTFWSSRNRRGAHKTFYRSDSCFVNDRWNDRAQSLYVYNTRRVTRPARNPNHPADGCVIIYQHCNYGGWKQHICGNRALNSLGKFHRQISSVKVGRHAKVTFYSSRNRRGAHKTFYRSDSCFVNDRWNDRAQSLYVRRR